MNKIKKSFGYCVLLLLVITFSGCTFTGSPRPRPGCYATSGANFCDVNSLGRHNYTAFIGENDGIVYTCRGGHIDLAHLRIGADNTHYLYNKVSKHLKSGDTDFTYGLGKTIDPSVFKVHITYPANFKLLPESERQKIIDEVSLEAGQYFTWQMVTWHEALTWFGLKAFLFASQFHSAFAWEDSYSNLMGTIVGAKAIRRSGNFNDAMTVALKEELILLGAQSADVSYYASEKMRGTWYEGSISTKMLLRNMDIGVGDGTVTPALVPDICSQEQPMNYPVPTLDTAKRYGFTVDLEIKVNGFGGNRCLKSIYAGGRRGIVIPAIHLPAIMECIQGQAVEKGYTVMR